MLEPLAAMKRIYPLLLTFCLTITLVGQKNVDLKLDLTSTNGLTSCFDFLLRSPDGQGIDLAGQNYRLFYDASQVSFLDQKISNRLDQEAYSKLDILKSEDQSIGFVSISTDGRILSKKGVHLPRNGAWINTLNVCFSRKDDVPFDLTWANRKKTFSFATAEVAMSEWVHEEEQQILLPNELYDFSSVDAESSFDTEIVINVFPNPVVSDINVVFSDHIDGTILIKDIIGRQVVNQNLEDRKQLSFDLTDWPEGSYSVIVLNQDGGLIKSKKIVKISR